MIEKTNEYLYASDIRAVFPETDLWAKVISKAIDDIIAFELAKERKSVNIHKDIEPLAIEASHFLFSDDYFFPFDNYVICISCPTCTARHYIYMTEFSSSKFSCLCGYLFAEPNNINYDIHEQEKEINLKELISLWGLNNIKKFRELLIKEIKTRKKQKFQKNKL